MCFVLAIPLCFAECQTILVKVVTVYIRYILFIADEPKVISVNKDIQFGNKWKWLASVVISVLEDDLFRGI